MEHRTQHQAGGVLVFLLIAFGLAWGSLFVAHWVLDLSLVNPLVQLPMAFSPAIAALIVRRWVTREGFRDAGLRPRVKAARRYYLLAWAYPVVVLAATIGLAMLMGLYRLDVSPLRTLFGVELPALAAFGLLLAVPVLAAPAFWGEEFGWRSYLQQRVGRRPVTAALVTGVIWAAWHYPLAFSDYVTYDNPAVGILIWTLRTVPLAVTLAWLFLRSGSVWVPCVAHAGSNLIAGTLTQVLLIEDAGLDPTTVELLGLFPVAAIALWILLTGQLTASKPAGSPGPTTRAAVHAQENSHAA
jgi:membrane protease YdiL (CAAX protease family)